mgnify:CR=1 FL=1
MGCTGALPESWISAFRKRGGSWSESKVLPVLPLPILLAMPIDVPAEVVNESASMYAASAENLTTEVRRVAECLVLAAIFTYYIFIIKHTYM